MTTETTFEQFVRQRFGVLKTGAHNPESEGEDCPACVLEALNACHDRRWTDDPREARCYDLRALNDASWSSDEVRTLHLVPVAAAYDGCLDWPLKRQKAVVTQIAIETIKQIVAELPGLPDEVREQCRAVTDLPSARAAADAAYAAFADAASADATYASAYATYAAADATAAANATYATDAANAAAAANAADKPLITACNIWLAAADTA